MQLAQRQQDGSTLREHLEAAAAASGRPDPLLQVPAVPRGCHGLLSAFNDLSASRPQGMGGACGIPPSEVQAWQQLRGLRLTGWELDTLALMDRAVLAAQAQSNRKAAP